MSEAEHAIVDEIKSLALNDLSEPQFYGQVGESVISHAEAMLGVKFPPSYRTYLQFLGAAKMMSYDFDGLPDNSIYTDEPPVYINVVDHTLLFRDEVDFFTNSMIYLTDDGSPAFYCLDTSISSVDGESPVYAYLEGKRIYVAHSFIEFVRLLTNKPKLYGILNENINL